MTAVARMEDRSQKALIALDHEMESRRATLEASAASLIDPQRLRGVVLAAFTRTPALWDCDPVTIARAVVEAAQYGLEPTGAIGGAHLVPFRNKRTGRTEAQLIIDYRGYVQLARRSGEVAKVVARVVREQDEFRVEQGSDERLVHLPYLGADDPGRYTHVYAVITYRDGTTQHDWDTWAWVQTIKKRSKASDNGPWVTDEPEMAKKSILRRLMKLAPLTIEARRAIDYEEREEAQLAAIADRRSHVAAHRPPAAVQRVHERLGITSGRPAEGPTPAGPDAEPVVDDGDGPPHPAATTSGAAGAVLGGTGADHPGLEPPSAGARTVTPDLHRGSTEAGTSGDDPGTMPAPSADPGATRLASGSAVQRCEGFHAEHGACRREAGHPGNHQNADKETWRPVPFLDEADDEEDDVEPFEHPEDES